MKFNIPRDFFIFISDDVNGWNLNAHTLWFENWKRWRKSKKFNILRLYDFKNEALTTQETTQLGKTRVSTRGPTNSNSVSLSNPNPLVKGTFLWIDYPTLNVDFQYILEHTNNRAVPIVQPNYHNQPFIHTSIFPLV